MTSDAIQLVGIQIDDKHKTESESIARESNDIQRAYNDAMVSIEYRRVEAEKEYKQEMARLEGRKIDLENERDTLRLQLEHADRQEANNINSRLATIRDQLNDIERDKAATDREYKTNMAQVARDTMYNDYELGKERNAINKMEAETNARKAENDRWLGARRLEVEEHTAMANVAQRERASRRESTQRERESQRATTVNLFNSIANWMDTKSQIDYRKANANVAERSLQLEQDKYGTSKMQFWVENLLAKPVNNLIYGVSRGIASSIVSKYTGGLNVQSQVQTNKEIFEGLFKD